MRPNFKCCSVVVCVLTIAGVTPARAALVIADFDAGVLAPLTTSGAGGSSPVVTIGTTYQSDNPLFVGNQLELDATGAFNGALRLNFGTGDNAFARDSATTAAFRNNSTFLYDYFQPSEPAHTFRTNHLTLRTDVPGYPGFTSSMPGSGITMAPGDATNGVSATAGTYEYSYGAVEIPGGPSGATMNTLFDEFINGAGTFIQLQIVQQSNVVTGDPVTTAYDNFRLVPEPTTAAISALGLILGLPLLRIRRRS